MLDNEVCELYLSRQTVVICSMITTMSNYREITGMNFTPSSKWDDWDKKISYASKLCKYNYKM